MAAKVHARESYTPFQARTLKEEDCDAEVAAGPRGGPAAPQGGPPAGGTSLEAADSAVEATPLAAAPWAAKAAAFALLVGLLAAAAFAAGGAAARGQQAEQAEGRAEAAASAPAAPPAAQGRKEQVLARAALKEPRLQDVEEGRLTFLSMQTKGDPLLAEVGHFESDFGVQVVNLGSGKNWTSYRTKVELIARYLRSKLGLVGYNAPGEVDQELVAFVDGSDAFWGGCELSAFRGAYAEVAAQSGASVVFGAEVVCGEQDCNKVPPVPRWAHGLSSSGPSSGPSSRPAPGPAPGPGGGRGVLRGDGDVWAEYAVGCRGTWTDECSAKRDCGYWAPCAQPPALKFLNSGFFMGPLRDISDMVEWALDNYETWSVWGDQSVFAQYWLDNPTRVTLDYTGQLVLSLSDMSEDIVAADAQNKLVRNVPLNRTQCLIHGNGRGRSILRKLLKQLGHASLAEERRRLLA